MVNYHGRICKKTPEKKHMQEILAKYLRFGKWFQNIRILYPYHQFFMVNVGKHTIVPWMRHGIDTPQLPVSPSLHVAPAPLSSSPANLKGPSPIQTKTTALLNGFFLDFATLPFPSRYRTPVSFVQ